MGAHVDGRPQVSRSHLSLKDVDPVSAIRARLGQLSGNSLKLATWLINLRPGEVPHAQFTTGEISRLTGLSRSAVVRFCQELGYEGFADFKAAWIKASTAAQSDGKPPHFSPAANRVIDMVLPSMTATLATLDPNEYNRAVEALCKASTVVWFGIPGDAAFLAQSGEHKMIRAALSARSSSNPRELASLSRLARKGDVLVVISQSGNVQVIADVFPEFKRRGAAIVAITSQVESVLTDAADIVLLTAARNVTLGGAPLGLRAPQLLLIDMLVLDVIERIAPVPLEWDDPALV